MNCIKNNINAKIGDITKVEIPSMDVLLCRDTLQHLSYDNIFKALKNFSKNNNIKYYIIGGYNEQDQNKNINNGEYFHFNITKNPFSLKPDSIVKEGNDFNFVKHEEPNKYLFIFEGNNFRNQVSRMM
jgi:effector-binding domain-containing protein